MDLVIDANVLFAALIKDSHTRHLILESGWTFYAPEFLLEEIREHTDFLVQRTGLSKTELLLLLDNFIMLARINIIPFLEFKEHIKSAEVISPDPDDAPYFALALKL